MKKKELKYAMPALSQKTKGILYVVVAAFGFSMMSVFVKLSGDLPAFQKAFFRNFIALLFILAMMRREKIPFRPEKGNIPALFGRCFCGTVGLLCNFYAIGQLNLSDANMLNKLSPFFAILFSVFLLKEKPSWVQVLGVLVALMGLARVPMLDVAAGWAGLQVAHAGVHPAFWIYFAGAFACGAAACLKCRWMPHIGVLTCAAALAAVLTLEAPAPVALLFLVMIGFIAFIVSVYSLGYMAHAHRQGWYWFFLLLTFASLAGIVSTPDMAAMYGYWELMTFASYFLVVHEADRVAFDAGFKYYLMCAGGALLMLPGLDGRSVSLSHES